MKIDKYIMYSKVSFARVKGEYISKYLGIEEFTSMTDMLAFISELLSEYTKQAPCDNGAVKNIEKLKNKLTDLTNIDDEFYITNNSLYEIFIKRTKVGE